MVTASSIYEVPLMLEDLGLGDFLVERLRLEQAQPSDLSEWRTLVDAHRDGEAHRAHRAGWQIRCPA